MHSRLLRAWSHDVAAERLDLPLEAALELVVRLRRSTLSLPPHQRSLQGFHMGYLCADP